VGKVRVKVGRRPSAAVLSTGDELAEPGTRNLAPAAIRDANSHLLAARCRALGLPTRRLGFVRDDRNRLRHALREGLESDILLVSGGVSMGRFDFVEPELDALGAERLVTAVAIRPGKPFVFAVVPRSGVSEKPPRLVFGLPGNPVSAFTTFEIFARSAIARMEGEAAPSPSAVRTVRAVLAGAAKNPTPRQTFQPAFAGVSADGRLHVRPIRIYGSADIAALALANALLVLPPRQGTLAAGAEAKVLPLAGFPAARNPASWTDPRTAGP